MYRYIQQLEFYVFFVSYITCLSRFGKLPFLASFWWKAITYHRLDQHITPKYNQAMNDHKASLTRVDLYHSPVAMMRRPSEQILGVVRLLTPNFISLIPAQISTSHKFSFCNASLKSDVYLLFPLNCFQYGWLIKTFLLISCCHSCRRRGCDIPIYLGPSDSYSSRISGVQNHSLL